MISFPEVGLSAVRPAVTMGRMAPAIQRFFKPSQVLFREGEASNCIYLIKKGTVAIRKMKGSGFVEIARIYSNEVLGELSFFDRLPRSATAVAMTDVEALEISFESLDRSYRTVPEYMRTIIAAVAERLRKANNMIRRLQKSVVTDELVEEQPPSEQDEAIAVASVPAATDAGVREAEPKALAGLEAQVTASPLPEGAQEPAKVDGSVPSAEMPSEEKKAPR